MLIAPLPYRVPVIVLLAVIGAANSVVDVSGFTLLQRTVPDAVLTRVLGVTWGLAMGAAAIGSFVAPAVLNLIGPRPAFSSSAPILPVLVLVTHRRLLEIDLSSPPLAARALSRRRAVRAALARRQGANRLTSRQGRGRGGRRRHSRRRRGDRFYIVDQGRLTIDAGARSVDAGPGDFFGEIALLRDVARTATVRATTDAALYALERDQFLAALTGHAEAHSEAHALATSRFDSG